MNESPDHLGARKEEVDALSLIYEELLIQKDNLSGSLCIPVTLNNYILVEQGAEPSQHVRFLPGVIFHFSTGIGYPESEPPQIELNCSWVPDKYLRGIEERLRKIWDDSRELCLYTMIDEVAEQGNNAFGLRGLRVPREVFQEIKLFSEREEKKQFIEGVYFCEICLENKKGVECFKLPLCEHIFCKNCLKEYYTLSIAEGMINQVSCINHNCTQNLLQYDLTFPRSAQDHKIFKYIAPRMLFPSTLSEIIPDNSEIINRYIRLIKQKFFETTTSTIYCPRQLCQAPIIPKDTEIQVIICTRCDFPFCRFCRTSWHGSGATCRPQAGILEEYLESKFEERKILETRYGENVLKRLLETYQAEREKEKQDKLNGISQNEWELSEKERRYREERRNEVAARKYIRENTMSCPWCNLIFSKSEGCNKMRCPRCSTCFCYLCGTILTRETGYAHFNSENSTTECRGRLFEGNMKEGYQPMQENGEGQMMRRRNENAAGDLRWREYQEWEDWEEEEQEGAEAEAEVEEEDFEGERVEPDVGGVRREGGM